MRGGRTDQGDLGVGELAVDLQARIKLRAVMPSGQPAKFWDQSVIVGKEPKTVTLPLAWNDTNGAWKITFTDLFSPETALTITLQVD